MTKKIQHINELLASLPFDGSRTELDINIAEFFFLAFNRMPCVLASKQKKDNEGTRAC